MLPSSRASQQGRATRPFSGHDPAEPRQNPFRTSGSLRATPFEELVTLSSRAIGFSTTRVSPGRRFLRAVGILLAIVASLVLVWGVVLALLWGYSWLRLGPDDLPALGDELAVLRPSGASAPANATTVMVAMTGAVDPTVPRPPELIGPVTLVQYGGPRAEPAVLSLPGQLPVTIDGEEDLPLAEAQRAGGTDLLVRAVADYSEVRIDHAVSLSIDALPALVDAAAPVEVCDADGCSRVTGEQLRRELEAADDEQLVELVAGVAHGLGQRIDGRFVVTSPLPARRVIDTLSTEVTTDVGLRGSDLLEVAGALATPVGLDTDTIPLVVSPETGTIVPLAEPAAVRFQHLREGTELRAAGEEGGTADLEADMVRAAQVAVLNGAGIDGLAGQVQVELETAGFSVVGTGNAAAFDRAETKVNYVVDDPAIEIAAVQLAELLDGATLEPLAQRPDFEGEAVDLLVTLGEDRANG
jgi:hypothetical protein